MYNEPNYAKTEMVKQTELSSIHSELLVVNEKTSSLLNEVVESLNKIHPYMEPSPMEKNSTGPSKPEQISLVNSLKGQLRFARENAEKLHSIVRHLNTLI